MWPLMSVPCSGSNARRTARTAELGQDFACMLEIKKVCCGEIASFDNRHLQFAHEPGYGHAKIVTHQEEALNMLAVALPQCLRQIRVLLFPLGVQPLLELVE